MACAKAYNAEVDFYYCVSLKSKAYSAQRLKAMAQYISTLDVNPITDKELT